ARSCRSIDVQEGWNGLLQTQQDIEDDSRRDDPRFWLRSRNERLHYPILKLSGKQSPAFARSFSLQGSKEPMTVRTTAPVSDASSTSIVDYYRCADIPSFGVTGPLNHSDGFFRFGPEVVCYGQSMGVARSQVNDRLFDASQHVESNGHGLSLPFDVRQVIDNLRYESYVESSGRLLEKAWIRDLYYRLRPLMPVSFRKHLQGIYLKDWERIAFPSWPVDCSVDVLLEKLLVIAMQSGQIDRLPFVWFWPDGHSACAIMTHDVETTTGRDFSCRTMDIDDEFGIKASFQIVPEKRYTVPDSYLESLRSRGFEVNVQGLDHVGNLFQNRKVFLKSARTINEYARQYNARG